MERLTAMTREEFTADIFKIYAPVSLLSRKNGGEVVRIRNKALGKDLVMRSYPQRIEAYHLLSKISCKNLPLIYDVIDLDDGQIVLEEFIEGITVAEVMETGKYRYRGTKKIIRELCFALSLLHKLGLVHRDVKPENIVIGTGGRVVLIDFNAARRVSAAKKDTVVMGTVGYASPEQLGMAASDARTDIYAVGVLLNVMISGKHPSELLIKGKAGRVVEKCTNVNPDKRYQSAESLAKEL